MTKNALKSLSLKVPETAINSRYRKTRRKMNFEIENSVKEKKEPINNAIAKSKTVDGRKYIGSKICL